MRLALDHHYSPTIAVQLRALGHDVVAAIEQSWLGLDDASLLAACAEGHRTLLTNDARDFTVIARQWSTEGRLHHGLVFTSDASLPRSRHGIGRFVSALTGLLEENPDPDALVDQIRWL